MHRALICALGLFILPMSAGAELQRFESKRPDGSTIHWSLDRPAGGGSSSLLVLAQGSGCLSAERNANRALARAAFPAFAVLTVEKYGVSPGDNPKDDVADCSAAFHRHFTVTQRIQDYLAVIQNLRSQTWWNGKLVLFGGSEGGAVSARLAAPARADAVILISTGGGKTFGQMVQQSIQENMARNNVPKEKWPPVEAIFARARANPQSDERFAGYTLRFWADAIDHRPLDAMLQSEAPILLIHGGSDTTTPVAVAHITRDAFATADRCNLTYWEMPGYDHGMMDAGGAQHMQDVLSRAAGWANSQLQQKNTSPCMRP